MVTPEQVTEIIQQAREAWMSGSGEAFASLFTPTGEFVVPGQKWQGQDAIRNVVTEFTSTHSNIVIEIRRLVFDHSFSDNTCVVIEWYWEDTQRDTGAKTHAEDAIVVDFEDGKIRRWREYIDVDSLNN